MVELADIFRRYGPEYRDKFKDRMLPSHLRAMQDIENCRTQCMGGHIYLCQNEACQEFVYSYHSCKNRHCPKCQKDQTQIWLQKQRQLLLPVPYFLVTFTLPEELRRTARSNQKTLYNILFRTSAAALQKLALDPRFIGGQIGMTGVLHTWDKKVGYHTHVHYLVPGGGLSPDHSRWLPAKNDFLVRVEPLSIIFRAKFRDALKKAGLFEAVPSEVWEKDWVAHSEPVGYGEEAVKYLARYVFRVAITNNRFVKLENDNVTFRYQDSDTKQWRLMSLPALEFVRRFLQHVLPKGFQKVRHYGLFSPTKRNLLAVARYILRSRITIALPSSPCKAKLHCPKCGSALRLVGRISRYGRAPPP